MNRNQTGISHSELVNFKSTQTSEAQSRTLCQCFRRRKPMWIICVTILAIFILLGITILTIFINKKENVSQTIKTTITLSTRTTIPTVVPITTTRTTITTVTVTATTTTTTEQPLSFILINNNTKWKQNGSTIAGGLHQGDYLHQLYMPYGMFVDDDAESVYIADRLNNRIVEWRFDAAKGKVVAGGNGQGNQTKQLNGPSDVTVDRKNNSLIICDLLNRRVVRWSRQNRTNGYIIISNIDCYGVAMDNIGNLYVSDTAKYEIRRWKEGDTNGTIVAGGNKDGLNLNQFNGPSFIFVDEDYSLYVSDSINHRVMKWIKNATEGIVVAGGQGTGYSLTEIYHPQGVSVDHLGNVYVADSYNHRIMRWLVGATEGSVVVGGNEMGIGPDKFYFPMHLSFDRKGNLYVVDRANNRVQKFDINVD